MDSINQELKKRVPPRSDQRASLSIDSNYIFYTAHDPGKYTIYLLIGDGCWDIMINTDDDYLNAFSDISYMVLQEICNTICDDGAMLYSTIYQNMVLNPSLVQGEWKDFGAFVLKYDVICGKSHYYIKYAEPQLEQGKMATVPQTIPPVTAGVAVPGTIDLRKCALAGQEDSINQQLDQRVPAMYGNGFVSFPTNTAILYASHSGGAGSYTMSLTGRTYDTAEWEDSEDYLPTARGYKPLKPGRNDFWELEIINALEDEGDGFSAVADINREVLKGICNAICPDGDTLYATIYNEWEGDETMTIGEWKDFGSVHLMFEFRSYSGHFYIQNSF